jgi:hypothetical protein
MDLTSQVRDLLKQLRAGIFGPRNAVFLEQLPAGEFLAGLRDLYPIVFQERQIGNKHEIALARSYQFEITVRAAPGSPFPAVHYLPVFKNCVLASAYDGAVSELTSTSRVTLRPTWQAADELLVKMSRGFKLDRAPDGWTMKPLNSRATKLSTEFLSRRGWNFTLTVPFTPTA